MASCSISPSICSFSAALEGSCLLFLFRRCRCRRCWRRGVIGGGGIDYFKRGHHLRRGKPVPALAADHHGPWRNRSGTACPCLPCPALSLEQGARCPSRQGKPSAWGPPAGVRGSVRGRAGTGWAQRCAPATSAAGKLSWRSAAPHRHRWTRRAPVSFQLRFNLWVGDCWE